MNNYGYGRMNINAVKSRETIQVIKSNFRLPLVTSYKSPVIKPQLSSKSRRQRNVSKRQYNLKRM